MIILFSIQTPQYSDYTHLIDLWEASVRATHYFLKNEDIINYKKLILENNFQSVVLYEAKDVDNCILGFIGLSGTKIEMLFVHPDYIGKGIGYTLLKFATEIKGAYQVAVNEQNTPALDFYQKFGFKIISRNPVDSEGKPYPILEMELTQQML